MANSIIYKEFANSIVLYDLSNFSLLEALEIGQYYFKILGIEPDLIDYQKKLTQKELEGDMDDSIRKTTITELKMLIIKGEVIDFGLSKTGKDNWEYAFNYKRHKETNCFYMEYLDRYRSFSDNGFVKTLVKNISEKVNIFYGIGFQLDSVVNTSLYFGGHNFLSISPYDNPHLWERTIMPYPGDEIIRHRYLEGRMRLVYCYNFLTQIHLNRMIQGIKLYDWIQANASRGQLNLLSNGLWCWEVAEENLEQVNLACHLADLLISYRTPTSPVKKRSKLP